MKKALIIEDEETCCTVMVDILNDYEIDFEAWLEPT